MIWPNSIFDVIRIALILPLISFAHFQCIGQKFYNLNWQADGPIWGTAIVLYVSDFVLFDNPLITSEEIISLDGSNIWRFDHPALSQFSPSSRTTSDHLRNILTIAPLALHFSKKMKGNHKEYAVMFWETMALNFSVTQFVKSSAGRVRPFIYNTDIPIEWKFVKTAKRSFFSGHVSHTASLSFLAARTFADLHPNSKLKPYIWASAIVGPALTGYFRYRAGRHFPSDLITGYAVGAIIGYFIPVIHRSTIKNKISVQSYGGNLRVVIRL